MAKKPAPKKKKVVSKKKVVKKSRKVVKMKQQKPIGIVTHFYGNINVAIVKFKTAVKVGTTLRFSGVTTDFEEKIKSMQFNHEAVAVAKKGKQIGIKVKKRVREGDEVYLGND